MDRRRFNRQAVNQVDAKRQIPDLTDFMNDMFYGAAVEVTDRKKSYNLTSGGERGRKEDDFDSSTRSVSSRQTQEWLEEAKRMVASSPSRDGNSPSRLSGSPRFAQGRHSVSSVDRRDPLSRSARRQRGLEGTFSGDILSKTAKHTRNRSETNLHPPQEDLLSPRSQVQKWVSSNIQIPNSPDKPISPDPRPPSPGAPPLPPRQSMHRRSRFQTDRTAPLSQQIPSPINSPAISIPKRNFKSPNNNTTTTILDSQLLSPPRHLVESAHRRSISSSTCSLPQADVPSPPRNSVESAHRRPVSSSTCRTDRTVPKELAENFVNIDDPKREELNVFLKEQRIKIEKLMNGEIDGKAKIVLSGPTNSTSSMVAAVCYAWLLENRMRENKKGGTANRKKLEFVVSVMNIRRGKMWKQRQAAWLFNHVGLDANALLFSNEVDLETLMMAKQLSMLVIGEDILKTNAEVRSPCTILADNYCEYAYDLLQTPILKKLLLAGILMDTQNLTNSTTRDAEAVQLLSVASTPNYRNTLFDQLMQDQKDTDFFKDLRLTYGTPPPDVNRDDGAPAENRMSEKNTSNGAVRQSSDKEQNEAKNAKTKNVSPTTGKPTTSPAEAPPKEAAKVPEKKNFFAKLFGFGSR